MSANFTPNIRPYGDLTPFRFWCQTVLPIVYDDSLSYYELLNKVVQTLNAVISNMDAVEDNTTDLLNAYNELQDYVNTYFDNLDIQQEIDTRLDEMASDGTLNNIIQPYAVSATEAWLAQHIEPTTPAVDDTLLVSGAAADSKTVGDKALLARGTLNSSDDCDTVIENGTWYVYTNVSLPAHWPFTGTGRLVVFGSTARTKFTKVQVCIDTNHNKIAVRSGLYNGGAVDEHGIIGSWTDWADILDEDFAESIEDQLDLCVKRYSDAITNTYWVNKGWQTIDDLPSNYVYRTDNTLLNASYGLAVTGQYSNIVILKGAAENADFGRITIQSAGHNIWIKNRMSGWVNLTSVAEIPVIKADILNLSKDKPYVYTPTWEQGSFSTPTWTKGDSSAANYYRFIRFTDYPSAAGIMAVHVESTGGYYGLYVGTKGMDSALFSAVDTGESRTFLIPGDKRTILNITAYKDHWDEEHTISPSDGSNLKVTLVPMAKKVDNLVDELDGIIIDNESDTIKIGLYGASIVQGYGVSDYSQHLDGDLVRMSDIGGTDFYKYTGTKTWANKFKSYMETNYPNVSVEQWAVGGSTAATYYGYLKASRNRGNTPLDTDVDIAIIMMGNNGRGSSMASNITNFMNIINLFHDAGAKVYMVTPTPAFNGSYTLNTYQIMQCVKAAANNLNCVTVDAFAWITDAVNHAWIDSSGNIIKVNLDYVANENNFLNSDRLHPGDLGHEMIFACMKNLLKV